MKEPNPVIISLRNQKFEVRANQTVGRALISLGLQPEAYLAVRDGELITEDIVLREGQQIKLVAVVSGGRQ